MLTNMTTAKRAMTTPSAVVWQPSALYRGAAEGAGCLSSSNAIKGGGLIQGHAFRTEGSAIKDRRQNQS